MSLRQIRWIAAAGWLILIPSISETIGAGAMAGRAPVKLRVAGAQIPVVREIDKNLAAVSRAIEYASSQNADVLVTPEGSPSGYVRDFDSGKTARALEEVTRKARAGHLALALGTCFEEPADRQRYDQVRIYDRDGNYLGFHAKVLLCRRVADPGSEGEIGYFKTKPVRTFLLNGVTIGALVCNDMWANPEWTPQDDPHLLQQLSRMGARVVFLSVNSGQAKEEEWALNREYHDSNLRLRARAAKTWIVSADASDPKA
ncbi:MAG TPA: carbon-nitrogen hydrolase family protein, partial [Acidobacteriota bacterium]|nr:carbon-nitrogen hydrolase family protein [Acidobacteriota bacterium]